MFRFLEGVELLQTLGVRQLGLHRLLPFLQEIEIPGFQEFVSTSAVGALTIPGLFRRLLLLENMRSSLQKLQIVGHCSALPVDIVQVDRFPPPLDRLCGFSTDSLGLVVEGEGEGVFAEAHLAGVGTGLFAAERVLAELLLHIILRLL